MRSKDEEFKIEVRPILSETDEAVTPAPITTPEGSVIMIIPAEQANTISDLEQALLVTNYCGMRQSISDHLSQRSGDAARLQAEVGQRVVANESPYRVDGEVGRFTFTTHQVLDGSKMVYNTACDLFDPLHSREWFRTTGFNELALIHGITSLSYGKTTEFLNRIRHQPNATPTTTLQHAAETEGADIMAAIESLSADQPSCCSERDEPKQMQCLPMETVQQKLSSLQLPDDVSVEELQDEILRNPVPYEDPAVTVNTSVDDVEAKKQKEKRSGDPVTDDRKRVHTTVCHIQKESASYTLAGESVSQALDFTTTFLQANQLDHLQLRFFTDGQRSLKKTIMEHFGNGPPMGLILDWPHLAKKCANQLSLGLKGRQIRNQILADVTPWLWLGLVDRALRVLDNIDPVHVKNQNAINVLAGYFKRNRNHIPCYALRKELGLRNSSNRVEKMNDLLVSDRQKHKGMSWSQNGSVALATITSLKLNQEYDEWLKNKKLKFKLSK